MVDTPPTQTESSAEDLIAVDAGGWGLTWVKDDLGRLRQVGLGIDGNTATCDTTPRLYPDAFPTWGGGDLYHPVALRVTHHDGTLTTRPRVEAAERLDEADGEHTVVSCRDEIFDLTVEHHLRTHPSSQVMEQWLEIVNEEPGAITLHDYDSMALFMLISSDAELCQFGGSGWADEWRWSTHTLPIGNTSLGSLGGVQPHLQRSPCLLLSPFGPSSETAGEVIGLSIAWGGNIRYELDVRPLAGKESPRELRLRAGANPYAAQYVLDSGGRFVSPTVAWTWSGSGRGEVTDRFHQWTRARVLRNPDRLRPLVVNNWEATYFDFDEARIVDLIQRSADIGADVFLLDDGWFGTDHPRDDDTTSLGDWDPDPAKLPDGLDPLTAAAAEAGIRFGIWLEPEMVNPISNLFGSHPDWIVRDRREPREHRNQFVLDSLLADVRDFEVDVVDRTLGSAPGISYVKWDANRPVSDPGSAALSADRQSNFWVDQVRATWDVMAEVARRHPDVEMMLCASGGGRNDHGTLRWFHEFWTSDNTDPVDRVRMQWACSHFFPSSAMAAHVTRWGGRPLAFACAVALSARFGFDLDLDSLSDEELRICSAAVSLARRTQPLVQMGVIDRFVSPVQGEDRSRAALSYRDREGRNLVVFAYQLESPTTSTPRLRLRGLNLDSQFNVRSTDLADLDAELIDYTTSGADLTEQGLAWPLDAPLTSAIWEITAV